MRNIVLIRHGKTEANIKRIYCGYSDLKLTLDGIEELKAKKHLYDFIDDTYDFYTSGLNRTNETMNVLFSGKEYKMIPEFKEMNFGDFELKSYEELKDTSAYQEWVKDYQNKKTPNGESFVEFSKRVIEAFQNLIETNKNNIVIITHGGVIYNILMYLFNEDKNIYELQPDNGEGVIIFDTSNKYRYELIK